MAETVEERADALGRAGETREEEEAAVEWARRAEVGRGVAAEKGVQERPPPPQPPRPQQQRAFFAAPALDQMAAGLTAGALSTVVLQLLDVVKTRLQGEALSPAPQARSVKLRASRC